jgi:hypothetical protein
LTGRQWSFYKVVIRAVTLVMLWPALFADFHRGLAAQIRHSTGKHRKRSRIAPKCYIQSDMTNPPANEIRGAETQNPKLS